MLEQGHFATAKPVLSGKGDSQDDICSLAGISGHDRQLSSDVTLYAATFGLYMGEPGAKEPGLGFICGHLRASDATKAPDADKLGSDRPRRPARVLKP